MIKKDSQKEVVQYKRQRRPKQGNVEGLVLSMDMGSEIRQAARSDRL